MTSEGEKLHYLDGLRGTAAFIVVLHHFSLMLFPAMLYGSLVITHSRFEHLFYHTPLNLLIGGNFAVAIFFVLSGYVLTFRFFRTKNKDILSGAAIKRYSRLAIPAGASVIIAFIIHKSGGFVNQGIVPVTGSSLWLSQMWNFPPSLWTAVYQGTYGAYVSGASSYNTNLWTMQYEFVGSILVFALASLFGTMGRRYLIYVALAIVLWKTWYLGFLIGMIFADIQHSSRWNSVINFASFSSWALIIIGLVLGSYPQIGQPDQGLYRLMEIPGLASLSQVIVLHTFGAGLLILGMLSSPFIKWFFSLHAFRFLGKISFSLYLIHLLVICSFSSYLFSVLIKHATYTRAAGIVVIISLPLIVGISYYYHKYIDLAGIRVSEMIRSRVQNNDRPSTPIAPVIAQSEKRA